MQTQYLEKHRLNSSDEYLPETLGPEPGSNFVESEISDSVKFHEFDRDIGLQNTVWTSQDHEEQPHTTETMLKDRSRTPDTNASDQVADLHRISVQETNSKDTQNHIEGQEDDLKLREKSSDTLKMFQINGISETFYRKFEPSCINSLQVLNFPRNKLGKRAIKVLCCDSSLKNLKALSLAENPVGNDGVKFISDTSNWNELKSLILRETQFDFQGAKHLAKNEIWVKLEELDLSQNPSIGALGVASLSRNRAWVRLNKLSFDCCNVRPLRMVSLRRKKHLRELLGKGSIDKKMVENSSIKDIVRSADNSVQGLEKGSFPSLPNSLNLQYLKNKMRGGFPEDSLNDNTSSRSSSLLTKLQQYKDKVLKDPILERELSFFVEVNASSKPIHSHYPKKRKMEHGNENGEDGNAENENQYNKFDFYENFENGIFSGFKDENDHHQDEKENKDDEGEILNLVFDIKRHFLYCDKSETPKKVLLLTGEAGIGKSLFCKHFQREILSDWNESQQSQECDSINWFPIYMKLSSLKNPKSEAILEILTHELSLTEEEILLLSTSQTHHPLFLLDGYNDIEDLYPHKSLKSYKDYVLNNFFALNKIEGESWKNAKIIITCREESLQKIRRRDLLFAPINSESSELAVRSEAFLQRSLKSFSDEQISCSLKKYYYFEKISRSIEDDTNSLIFPASDSGQLPHPLSWSQINEFEKMIDDFGLRDMARIPLLLKMMQQVLPKLDAKTTRKILEQKSALSNKLSALSLLEQFVNEVIRSVTEKSLEDAKCSRAEIQIKSGHNEEETLLMKRMWQQIQSFALRSKGYFIKLTGSQDEQEDESLLLKLHPLVEWEARRSQFKFCCPLILEFCIAKSIQEEIKNETSQRDQKMHISDQLFLNQRLLASTGSDLIIIHFLIDAIQDETLTSDQLISLIYLSRQQELSENRKSARASDSHSPFSIAAANSITILCASGYNFSNQDLSNICIPYANLSHGIFEGTKFHNADLQGVDFSNTSPKEAQFIGANMKNVDFGEGTSLNLENKVLKHAFSPDGRFLAADVGEEIVIFENIDILKSRFKEMRRLPGSFLGWEKTISSDGSENNIVSALTERSMVQNEQKGAKGQREKINTSFCISDVTTGHSIKAFKISNELKQFLSFDPRKEEVFTFNDGKIQKYNVTSNSCSNFKAKVWNMVTSCDFSPKITSVLLVIDYDMGIILCDSNKGKTIRRHKGKMSYGEFNSDGKQIISGTVDGTLSVIDTVRGSAIKIFPSQTLQYYEVFLRVLKIENCSFHRDGKLVFWTTKDRVVLKDVAEAKSIFSISKKALESHSFHLDGNQFAVSQSGGIISFKKVSSMDEIRHHSVPLREAGPNGVNLRGAIINTCFGLSKENSILFQEKGDYGGFKPNIIEELFLCTSRNPEDIREVAFIESGLSSAHARIIGFSSHWINLQKLDISRNYIGDKGGEVIGNNKSWINLEELNLTQIEIGDTTAREIANNQAWKNLKALRLALNQISFAGAKAIGQNKAWLNLEILDLRSNRIDEEKVLKSLCRNRTWKNLKSLLLQGNPARFKDTNIINAIEAMPSSTLEVLAVPQATFEKNLLHIFKYASPKDVTELLFSNKRCNDIIATIIASKETWTNLKKLDLSGNGISNQGGNKIALNNSWVNLEVLDLSQNKLKTKVGLALGGNKSWNELKVLNLSSNQIENEGASAIGENMTWTKLQTLKLAKNSIGNAGAAGLSKNAAWIHLKELDLSGNSISHEGATELSKNKVWVCLEILDLEKNSIESQGAAALSTNVVWTHLKELNLHDNKICHKGAASLSENTSWAELQALKLGENKIKPAGAVALSKNKTWKLQTLKLGGCSIGNEGAEALSKNPAWVNLQILDLRSNNIDGKGAAKLGDNKFWIKLQILDLQDNLIDAEGAAKLIQNIVWTSLEELNLQLNKLSPEGATELRKNTSWANLKTLNLGQNEIKDEGATKLSNNKTWTCLQALRLQNNKISDSGIAELTKNPSWVHLQELKLGNNLIRCKGAEELAKSKTWGSLQMLGLSNNSIGAKGAAELSNNQSWTKLQELDLQQNKIGPKGAAALGQNKIWKNLQVLNLSNNAIEDEGVKYLSKNTAWKNLKTLNLSINQINYQGISGLCENTTWMNLEALDLSNNSIGNEGVKILSRNNIWINLQSLHLGQNGIRDEGAIELSKNTTWVNLQKIVLLYNGIGRAGIDALKKNTAWPDLPEPVAIRTSSRICN